MKPPFKTPILVSGDCLVDADSELICGTEAASKNELAYIVMCVNNHKKLLRNIKDLCDYAQSATLEGDPLPKCVHKGHRLVSTL